MPKISIKIKLGSRRVSLGMAESWSGAAIQPDAQSSRRGDRVLHVDPHPAHRRRLEPAELAVAHRGAAAELAPAPGIRRSVHRGARAPLPPGHVLLDPAQPPRQRPTATP